MKAAGLCFLIERNTYSEIQEPVKIAIVSVCQLMVDGLSNCCSGQMEGAKNILSFHSAEEKYHDQGISISKSTNLELVFTSVRYPQYHNYRCQK